MMTKFLFGVALVGFTSFCGYFLAKKYRQRKNFFAQFHAFNERFISEVSYYRRPIREFVGAYSYHGEFQMLLSDFLRASKQKEVRFEADRAEYSFLKRDEQSAVQDYFMMLGRGDSASQKAYFSSMNDTLAKWHTESVSLSKKYGDLYVKLGFLCGLFLLILIM
jgi:stage III sporulation protein AB